MLSFVQVGESEPFVSELLTTLPTTIADLEHHQIHSFYESVSLLYIRFSTGNLTSVQLSILFNIPLLGW